MLLVLHHETGEGFRHQSGFNTEKVFLTVDGTFKYAGRAVGCRQALGLC